MMDEHRRILDLAARGDLPETVSPGGPVDFAVFRELVADGYLEAVADSDMQNDAFLRPRITVAGREKLAELRAQQPGPRLAAFLAENLRQVGVGVAIGLIVGFLAGVLLT